MSEHCIDQDHILFILLVDVCDAILDVSVEQQKETLRGTARRNTQYSEQLLTSSLIKINCVCDDCAIVNRCSVVFVCVYVR